jgi:hypothetical protein
LSHIDVNEGLVWYVVGLFPAAELLKAPASQQEKEKTLLKLYINFGVLTRLGYVEEKVLKVSSDVLRVFL